jgi:hypothetical protein
VCSNRHQNGNATGNTSTMKKNVTLLLFFAIATVVFMASYRSKENSHTAPMLLLTSHSWKFQKAESLNSRSAFVVNALYDQSQYNFTKQKTFQGEFFDRPIQGTWTLANEHELVLNKGTIAEERMEIAELTEDVLKVRVIERGASVTITYN